MQSFIAGLVSPGNALIYNTLYRWYLPFHFVSLYHYCYLMKKKTIVDTLFNNCVRCFIGSALRPSVGISCKRTVIVLINCWYRHCKEAPAARLGSSSPSSSFSLLHSQIYTVHIITQRKSLLGPYKRHWTLLVLAPLELHRRAVLRAPRPDED